MNCKWKSRRRFFLHMWSRTPPISLEFLGGIWTPQTPPLGTPLAAIPSFSSHFIWHLTPLYTSCIQFLPTSHTLELSAFYINISNTLTLYTGCPRRNVKYFGRVFLMLNYTDITQNNYFQSWTVTELMAIEKCGLLWCPRTVRRPWRNIHPLRKPGKELSSCSNLDESFITR